MATEDMPATLRDGLALLPLDGDTVVFCAATQRLIGLNASATSILRGLQAGRPQADLADMLTQTAGLGAQEARHWVTTTLAALRLHGMLAGHAGTAPSAEAMAETDPEIARMPPLPDYRPALERRYCLLGTSVLIRFGHFAQVRLVDSVIGHLAVPGDAPPSSIIDIPGEVWAGNQLRSDIYRDGRPVGQARQLSYLGPRVKALVWQAAVNAHDFLLYIHAGVVGTGRGCVLLPAAPGSGKSSGYTYFSDEVALIEPGSFLVPPVPLAICVKDTGWDLMAQFHPGIGALPVHRREDAKVVRYIPPPAGAAWPAPAPVRHIVFPRFVKDAPTTFAPVARSAALGRLMDECMALRGRLDRAVVGQLVDWIAGIDCFEMIFSSLDAAVAHVTQAIGPPDAQMSAITEQNVWLPNLDDAEQSW